MFEYLKLKYFKTLIHKMKKYDKNATNPFINNKNEYNPLESIYKQTYIWIENTKN